MLQHLLNSVVSCNECMPLLVIVEFTSYVHDIINYNSDIINQMPGSNIYFLWLQGG